MHPPAIEQWRDKADLVHVPTVYDAAHRAGLKTAQVDWVAILNSGTIDYEFLELPTLGGAMEKELIDAGEITVMTYTDLREAKRVQGVLGLLDLA